MEISKEFLIAPFFKLILNVPAQNDNFGVSNDKLMSKNQTLNTLSLALVHLWSLGVAKKTKEMFS